MLATLEEIQVEADRGEPDSPEAGASGESEGDDGVDGVDDLDLDVVDFDGGKRTDADRAVQRAALELAKAAVDTLKRLMKVNTKKRHSHEHSRKIRQPLPRTQPDRVPPNRNPSRNPTQP